MKSILILTAIALVVFTTVDARRRGRRGYDDHDNYDDHHGHYSDDEFGDEFEEALDACFDDNEDSAAQWFCEPAHILDGPRAEGSIRHKVSMNFGKAVSVGRHGAAIYYEPSYNPDYLNDLAESDDAEDPCAGLTPGAGGPDSCFPPLPSPGYILYSEDGLEEDDDWWSDDEDSDDEGEDEYDEEDDDEGVDDDDDDEVDDDDEDEFDEDEEDIFNVGAFDLWSDFGYHEDYVVEVSEARGLPVFGGDFQARVDLDTDKLHVYAWGYPRWYNVSTIDDVHSVAFDAEGAHFAYVTTDGFLFQASVLVHEYDPAVTNYFDIAGPRSPVVSGADFYDVSCAGNLTLIAWVQGGSLQGETCHTEEPLCEPAGSATFSSLSSNVTGVVTALGADDIHFLSVPGSAANVVEAQERFGNFSQTISHPDEEFDGVFGVSIEYVHDSEGEVSFVFIGSSDGSVHAFSREEESGDFELFVSIPVPEGEATPALAFNPEAGQILVGNSELGLVGVYPAGDDHFWHSHWFHAAFGILALVGVGSAVVCCVRKRRAARRGSGDIPSSAGGYAPSTSPSAPAPPAYDAEAPVASANYPSLVDGNKA